MLGVYPVSQALSLAQDRSLDLIEIAPNAKPPTCKIMDYGKHKYETKKKQQAAKKKQTIVLVKEIQLRPRTDEHDLDVKMKHATRFLLEGNKVKVNLSFRGREMAHQQVGYKLLVRVTEKLDAIANAEVAPKMEGRQLFVIMAPDASKIKLYKAQKKNKKTDVPLESQPDDSQAEQKAKAPVAEKPAEELSDKPAKKSTEKASS